MATMFLIVLISKSKINIYLKTSNNTRSKWVSIRLTIKNSKWCMEILTKWWWCLQWITRCQGLLPLWVKWRQELSSTMTLQCLPLLCFLQWITLYLLCNLFRLVMQVDSSTSLKTWTTCKMASSSMVRTLTKWCIRIQTMQIKTLIWCSSNMLSNSRWCKCSSSMIRTPKVSMILLRHPSWSKWQSMKKIGSHNPISLRPI